MILLLLTMWQTSLIDRVVPQAMEAAVTSLNRTLRATIVQGAAIIMPGAGNALTARIVERSGHKVAAVSGAAVANSYLGVPDLGLVSLNELVSHVAAMREVVSMPLVVDADTGFGNALNTRHTVRMLERAGANGIILEDQTFPKRCGHFDNKEVVPKEEMVQKIKAAVDARLDHDLMIMARTDARAVEGFESALDRIRAYQEAGADILFLEAPLSKSELSAIPREVPGIHCCNMVFGGKTPCPSREELAQMGFAVIGYGNAALQASMLAMQRVLQHLNDHGSLEGVEKQLMIFKDRQELVDGDFFSDLSRRYGTRPAS